MRMGKVFPNSKMKTKDFRAIIDIKIKVTDNFFLGYNEKTFKKKYPFTAWGAYGK
jgi:hypothetical protein